MLTYYFIGAVCTAVVWFLLVKVRQGGFYIKMPGEGMGYFLEPLDHDHVDYKSVMAWWVLFTIAWPLAWSLFIFVYVFGIFAATIIAIWSKTFGNEGFVNKIFGVKK